MSRQRLTLGFVLGAFVVGASPGFVQADQGEQRNAAATGSSSSGDMCIRPESVQGIDECPSNAAGARGGGSAPQARMTGGEQPRSRFHEAERKEEKKEGGMTGPSIDLSVEARMNREAVEERAWELLQREVRVLRRLVDNTRVDDPRRPDILLRLAETYFEMQQAVRGRIRSFDDPIYQACTVQKNRGKCRQLRQRQKRVEQRLDGLRQESIRTYATLVQDHPNYRRMDEVLFALAFGLEQMDQMERARRVYHRLIKSFPQSDFIPHAYLSFAEFFFNEGEMRPALQFYGEVTEFPPARNPVYGYALYKSAWANYNIEDFRASLQSFVEVIEFAQSNPDASDAENLARQARRELVMPYAMVGTPGRALEFFSRYAQNRAQALDMLESLAELYYDTGQWPNTISVYHKLMSEASDSDKLCYWQSRVTNAVVSSKAKDEQVREVRRMVDVFDTFKQQDRPAEAKSTCKQESATILVSLATSWHREAIGTDTQPGTNDRRTMDLATRLYRVLLDRFPDMGDMEFPDIDRRDWPTQYKVSYYYAELLWKMEEWAQCGPAFDKVVELDPSGEYTRDAAYAAVLCYNNLYQQQYQGRQHEVQEIAEDEGAEQYAPREFTDLERGMLAAFRRYICFIPDSEELPTIKYRQARIYYEAKHWEEAAVLFKDIATNHPKSDLGVYAANLYLDTLNVLGSKIEDPRTSCIVEIKNTIEPFFGSYCDTQQKADMNAELCGVLSQLRCDVLRKEAEGYQRDGEFKKAGATYVTIFRKFQECGSLDEVLYNAALNFEAAKLLGNAIKVRNVLIERYPESELSKKAIYLLGSNWHAIAVYDRASEYYERFAREFPGEDGDDCTEQEKENDLCPIAHEALMNAVFFRLGLGQEEKAVEDAELFERNYRRKMPREAAKVVFAVGSIYERRKQYNKIVDHYRSFLRRYRRGSMPQQTISANIKIARSYWVRDDRRRAKGYLTKIVREWTRRNAARDIQGLDGVSEAEKVSYLREAIDGVAEALFYLAEYEFDEFQKIPFPRYDGRGTLDSVKKWSESKFKDWVEDKMKALQAAEAEYNKIAEVKVPVEAGGTSIELQSPPWQIAGAARVGEMYYTFVQKFRDAPIPNEIKDDPELRDIYLGALDEQSEPLVKKAKESFEFCLVTATNVRWFNEWSHKCEENLNELDPRQYPLAAELRGDPEYVYRTIARPAGVELQTGEDETGLGGGVDAGEEGGAP